MINNSNMDAPAPPGGPRQAAARHASFDIDGDEDLDLPYQHPSDKGLGWWGR